MESNFRVYCDHFITRKTMTHEEKLVYFLKKIQNEKYETENSWRTKVQFPPEHNVREGNFTCELRNVKPYVLFMKCLKSYNNFSSRSKLKKKLFLDNRAVQFTPKFRVLQCMWWCNYKKISKGWILIHIISVKSISGKCVKCFAASQLFKSCL